MEPPPIDASRPTIPRDTVLPKGALTITKKDGSTQTLTVKKGSLFSRFDTSLIRLSGGYIGKSTLAEAIGVKASDLQSMKAFSARARDVKELGALIAKNRPIKEIEVVVIRIAKSQSEAARGVPFQSIFHNQIEECFGKLFSKGNLTPNEIVTIAKQARRCGVNETHIRGLFSEHATDNVKKALQNTMKLDVNRLSSLITNNKPLKTIEEHVVCLAEWRSYEPMKSLFQATFGDQVQKCFDTLFKRYKDGSTEDLVTIAKQARRCGVNETHIRGLFSEHATDNVKKALQNIMKLDIQELSSLITNNEPLETIEKHAVHLAEWRSREPMQSLFQATFGDQVQKCFDTLFERYKDGSTEEIEIIANQARLAGVDEAKIRNLLLEKATATLEKNLQGEDKVTKNADALARYIIRELPECGIKEAGELEETERRFGLVEPLQYDPDTGDLYILKKSRKSVQEEGGADGTGGANKLFSTCLSVRSTGQVVLAGNLIFREPLTLGGRTSLEHQVTDIEHRVKTDIEIFRKNGLGSFVKFHTCIPYGHGQKQIGIFVPKFDFDLVDIPAMVSENKENPSVNIQRAQTIMGQLIDQVATLHRKGFLHLDIKGENVLFKEDGEKVLLFDFDFLFNAADPDANEDAKDSLKDLLYGTPCFTPPEFLEAQTSEKSQMALLINPKSSLWGKADVWATGLTLLECLMGSFIPSEFNRFYENNPQAAKKAVLDSVRATFEEAKKIAQRLPEDEKTPFLKLITICQGMLEADPHKRWSMDKAQEEWNKPT